MSDIEYQRQQENKELQQPPKSPEKVDLSAKASEDAIDKTLRSLASVSDAYEKTLASLGVTLGVGDPAYFKSKEASKDANAFFDAQGAFNSATDPESALRALKLLIAAGEKARMNDQVDEILYGERVKAISSELPAESQIKREFEEMKDGYNLNMAEKGIKRFAEHLMRYQEEPRGNLYQRLMEENLSLVQSIIEELKERGIDTASLEGEAGDMKEKFERSQKESRQGFREISTDIAISAEDYRKMYDGLINTKIDFKKLSELHDLKGEVVNSSGVAVPIDDVVGVGHEGMSIWARPATGDFASRTGDRPLSSKADTVEGFLLTMSYYDRTTGREEVLISKINTTDKGAVKEVVGELLTGGRLEDIQRKYEKDQNVQKKKSDLPFFMDIY